MLPSKNQIEEMGVTALSNFLSGARRVRPQISKNDKTPAWDGYLLVYQNANTDRKDNIQKIDVQLKSHYVKTLKNRNESKQPVSIVDLNIYEKNEGIVYLQVLLTDTTKYELFAESLFPRDIQRIRKKSKPSSKTCQITLRRFRSYEDFEAFILRHIKLKPKQIGFIAQVDEPMILSKTIRSIELDVAGPPNKPSAMFDPMTKIYLTLDSGIQIPSSLELFKYEVQRNDLTVHLDDKLFFSDIHIEYIRGKETVFKFNSFLSLSIEKSGTLQFFSKVKDNTSLQDFYSGATFLNGITSGKQMRINDRPIGTITDMKDLKFDQSMLGQIHKHIEFLSPHRMDPLKYTVSQYLIDYKTIELLSSAIMSNATIELDDIEGSFDIRLLDLKAGGKILFLLERANENRFTVTDFFSDIDSIFTIKNNEGEIFPCGKFVSLPMLLQGNLHYHVDLLIGKSESILHNLKEYYHYELASLYNDLSLNLIKGFDLYKEEELLDLSLWIIDHLDSDISIKENYQCINTINRLQIFRRQRSLSLSEKNEIRALMQENQHEPRFMAAFHLLLGEIESFQFQFERLDDEVKSSFRTWPIYYLYNNANSLNP